MEDQSGLKKERRSIGAIYAFISLGFVLHAAVICTIGIAWMHINELNATIKTFKKGCGCDRPTHHEKREVISSSQAAPNLQAMLLLQLQDKLSNLQHQYQVSDSDLRREITSASAELRQEFQSDIAQVQKQLGDIRVRIGTQRVKVDTELAEINSTVIEYHKNKADITCPSGYRLNPHRGTCVRFVQTPLSWFDARSTCEKDGEFLATFDTVESASWFRHQQLTRGWSGILWIGARKLLNSNEFRWYGINTGPVIIGYWGAGEPSHASIEHCIASWKEIHYYWGDYPCEYKGTFLCEQKMFELFQ